MDFIRRPVLLLLALPLFLGLLTTLNLRTTSAAAAQNLTAVQVCGSDGSVNVSFSWTPSKTGQQWIDLSLFDNDFAPGTFLGQGSLGSASSSFKWDGLLASRLHFVRINTLAGGSWAASNTLSFTTRSCGGSVSPGLETLRSQIEQRVTASGFSGVAVAVTDLQTGETISANGNAPQLTGCTINFFVLLQAVRDVEAGLYPESTVGDLIAATIYGSNPVTARDVLLISGNGNLRTGIDKVNDLIETLGMTETFYDHPPAYIQESITGGHSNLTTAEDFNRALTAFWQGSVTSLQWRDYLLDKMTGVKPGLQYLLPAGVGDGVTSHKNGFLWISAGYVDNDIGIVTFERGGITYAYVITFFTQNVQVKYADIPLGQAVSGLAWDYFNSRYP